MASQSEKKSSAAAPGQRADIQKETLVAYWKRNITLTLSLLAVWFLFGYIFSIVLAPTLNQFTILGGPAGFWMAHNGAIYVFWILILVYAISMNRLDEEFDLNE